MCCYDFRHVTIILIIYIQEINNVLVCYFKDKTVILWNSFSLLWQSMHHDYISLDIKSNMFVSITQKNCFVLHCSAVRNNWEKHSHSMARLSMFTSQLKVCRWKLTWWKWNSSLITYVLLIFYLFFFPHNFYFLFCTTFVSDFFYQLFQIGQTRKNVKRCISD